MQRTKAPKGASMENNMIISPFGIAMLIAFAVMIVAKVFEMGIGATLSWWIVLLPIYGPILLVAALVITSAIIVLIYNILRNNR